MPLENEIVPVRAGDLRGLLGMLHPERDWEVVPADITELIGRMHGQLHAERAAGEPAEAEVVPMPPGRWGRVEMPGRREDTGWINEELRFGVQLAVVRDWDGGEIAAVAIGPACRVVYLPAPLRRPEPLQQRAALPAGDSYVWYGDGEPDPEADF